MTAERAVRKVFDKDMGYIERIEKTYRENGFMANKIAEVGGDESYLKEVRQALDDLYRALEEAQAGALQHITQEQTDPAIQDVRRLAGLN